MSDHFFLTSWVEPQAEAVTATTSHIRFLPFCVMLGVNFPFKIDAFVLNKSKITLSSSSLKLTFLSRLISVVEQPAIVVADDISDLFTLVSVTAQFRS